MFSTRDDNVSSLKNATPSFQENTSQAQDDLRHAANKAGHRFREMVDSAGDNLSQAGETVTSQIRANPMQSSLIALAAGFLVGSLFRR